MEGFTAAAFCNRVCGSNTGGGAQAVCLQRNSERVTNLSMYRGNYMYPLFYSSKTPIRSLIVWTAHISNLLSALCRTSQMP
jgi:hypothetical protein